MICESLCCVLMLWVLICGKLIEVDGCWCQIRSGKDKPHGPQMSNCWMSGCYQVQFLAKFLFLVQMISSVMILQMTWGEMKLEIGRDARHVDNFTVTFLFLLKQWGQYFNIQWRHCCETINQSTCWVGDTTGRSWSWYLGMGHRLSMVAIPSITLLAVL